MAVAQTPSLSTLATDPLRNFKFQVTLYPSSGSPIGSASVVMGFMTVSGIATNISAPTRRNTPTGNIIPPST